MMFNKHSPVEGEKNKTNQQEAQTHKWRKGILFLHCLHLESALNIFNTDHIS